MKSPLADMLSYLRREKRINQRQAAHELGISQALLSHYENGVREPRLEFIIRACDYYGVTADYLIGRTASRGAGTEETGAAAELKRAVDALGSQELSAEFDNYFNLSLARAADMMSGGGRSGEFGAALALSELRLREAAEKTDGLRGGSVILSSCEDALRELSRLIQAR